MACKICKKESFITFGNDEYCPNCFNNLFKNDNIELPLVLNISDDSEKIHTFKIDYLALPTMIRFIAKENNGYEIEKGYNQELPIEYCLNNFLDYIQKVINTKSIEDRYLKMKGSMKVEFNGIRIDDGKFSPNEVFKMLTCYEGYNVNFIITDSSEEIITKDDILVKMELNEELLLEEYNVIKYLFIPDNYLSLSNEMQFEYVFLNYVIKLKQYYDLYPRRTAKLVDYIIKDLENVLCDSKFIKDKIEMLENIFYLQYIFLED